MVLDDSFIVIQIFEGARESQDFHIKFQIRNLFTLLLNTKK